MNYKIIALLFLFSLTLLSCKDKKSLVNQSFTKNVVTQTNNHPGKKLMETYCYACHNPTTDHENRIAPPMIAIKKHYISSNTSKEEFINSIQQWINNPNEDDAKMFGAIKRFGVMVKQPFPAKDIKLIAEYLYENDIDKPDWFEEHEKEMKNKN